MIKQCVKILSVLIYCLCIIGCETQVTEENTSNNSDDTSTSNTSLQVKEYQLELIDIAFRSASVLPSNPFIKEKSRNQEQVVYACIDLGLYNLASDYASKIENWRKSKCDAELAVIYAKNGSDKQSAKYIELANQLYDDKQEWRNDEININIARAYAYLKKYDKALGYIDKLDKKSHITKVYGIKSVLGNLEDFEKAIDVVEQYSSNQKFYEVTHSLSVLEEMYDQYYQQKEQRETIEKIIFNLIDLVPYIYSYNCLAKLCEISLQHNDKEKAEYIADKMSSIVNNPKFEWRLEDIIGLSAKLAALKYKVGLEKEANKELRDSYNLYKTEGEKIGAMFRGGPLRILAESYNVAGKREQSLFIYKLAMEQAVINPNTRPQAADLTSTCCSLALNRIKPDEQLMSMIKKIYKDFN